MSNKSASSVVSAESVSTDSPETTVSPAFVGVVCVETVSRYNVADAGEKRKIRNRVEGNIRRALDGFDFQAAYDAKATLEALGPVKSDVPEIPANVRIATRARILLVAADMLLSGEIVPEGMDAVDMSDLPEIVLDESDVEKARSIASAKITRSAQSEDIEVVVRNAFNGVESGAFLTIAQIARLGGHSRGTAASGAIAARLFPKSGKCTIEGIVPVERTATNVRGARKV